MIGFSYTQQNLKTLAFGTCIFGGIFWTSKHFDNKRKLIKICADSREDQTEQYQISKLSLFDTFSAKAVMAVFYSYLAININSFLIGTGICDVETLIKGYLIVTGALFVDVGKDVYETLALKVSKK